VTATLKNGDVQEIHHRVRVLVPRRPPRSTSPAESRFSLISPCMLKRPLCHPLLRPNKLSFQSRLVNPRGPLQSRFYARPAHKGPNPLWFVATVAIGFTSFFYLVKSRRGLGIVSPGRLTYRPNEPESNRRSTKNRRGKAPRPPKKP
jgi:hypothetical protein